MAITLRNTGIPAIVGVVVAGAKWADERWAATGEPPAKKLLERVVVYGGAGVSVLTAAFMRRPPEILEDVRSPLVAMASERIIDAIREAAETTTSGTRVVLRQRAASLLGEGSRAWQPEGVRWQPQAVRA